MNVIKLHALFKLGTKYLAQNMFSGINSVVLKVSRMSRVGPRVRTLEYTGYIFAEIGNNKGFASNKRGS